VPKSPGDASSSSPADVALNEQSTAPSERLAIPSLLDFADIQPIEMPVIALEQHIAEKVHAYTATYGPQEQQSTRIKDLIDLLLIADLAAPYADRLHASLAATFRTRERQPLPTALPPPPDSWASPYARAAADVGLPADLGTAHAEAATFLDPILAGATTGRWNPTGKRWTTS
jgi:Nucleotidyl transferase AbiEii toxin, Type IV TA system